MKRFCFALFAAACVTISAQDAAAQGTLTRIELNVPNGDWKTPADWVLNPDTGQFFFPGQEGFAEDTVGISNGGTVTLSTPNAPGDTVSGIIIGETGQYPVGGPATGTLTINGTGQLTVRPGNGIFDGVRVGADGAGTLNILDNGRATFSTMQVGGNAASALNLSGNARLDVVGAGPENIVGAANVERVTRITGPNVTFSAETLRVRGTFIPEITGPTHSAISVSGAANLGGTLQVAFNGHTPAFGESWTLINAGSVSGAFANIDASMTPLERGLAYDLSYNNAAAGGVKLSVGNRLVLNVDRRSGVASIENPAGGSVDIDGYTIFTQLGVLDAAGWSSFQDANRGDWQEANPTANRLSELNPTGSSMVTVGESIAIGAPYRFTPTALGQSAEDLVFEYAAPSGQKFQGIVEYTGDHNNLVLNVDPETGRAAVRNTSIFDVEVTGYTIGSASGSLAPGDGAWSSLTDQSVTGWEEANPTAMALSELNATGATMLARGGLVDLGTPFSLGGARDLTFEFLTATGELIAGVVEYGEIVVQPMLDGDTNGDGTVDLNDLNAVRNNFGAVGAPDGTLAGDAFRDGGFDGVVDLNDLNVVRNNFGAVAAPQAVPEPGSMLLCGMGLGGLFVVSRRRGCGRARLL